MTAEPTAATPVPAADDDVLRVEHISKRFGAVLALHDVNLHLRRGEVLGLLGDNGAGKSTLIKIICGFQPATSGRIILDGNEVSFKTVDQARAAGIDTVYQDLALINELTVYHNMFLNRERTRMGLLSNRSMRKAAREQLDRIGINLQSVDSEVAKLSGGQRQAIAVARVVTSNAKVLLLDEPLAAMGAKEGALILELVKDLKAQGQVSIIMIMHNYGQALEVCDRINLLQHGEITFDKLVKDTSVQELNDIVIEEYRRALKGAPAVGLSPGVPRATRRGPGTPAGRPGCLACSVPTARAAGAPAGPPSWPPSARPPSRSRAAPPPSGGADPASSAAAPAAAQSAVHWHSCSVQGASMQCASLAGAARLRASGRPEDHPGAVPGGRHRAGQPAAGRAAGQPGRPGRARAVAGRLRRAGAEPAGGRRLHDRRLRPARGGGQRARAQL